MKKYFIFIFMAAIFAESCSLKAVEQKRSFIIQPKIEYTAKHKTNQIIEVMANRCDVRFNSSVFYYKKNNYEFMPYATVNWVESPCYMIQSDVINAIENSGMFKMATSSSSLIKHQYKLMFVIEDLEPIFTKKLNCVEVKMRFSLFDKDNRLISSYLLDKREKIKDIHVRNVVDKINSAVKFEIYNMLKWLDRNVDKR